MPDTLELFPDDDAVTHALQWLEGTAEREGWPHKVTFGLTLSVDEALTNIVSYAFDPQPDGGARHAITLTYRHDDDFIHVELRDNGREYDPTETPPHALATQLDDAEIGGHGIRLMRHYLHDLTYTRENGWNCLTLTVKAAS